MPHSPGLDDIPLTGTHDDILGRLARAEALRAWESLPRKSRAARAFFPFYILAGKAVALFARTGPADFILDLHHRGMRGLAGKNIHPFDDGDGLEKAAGLLQRLQPRGRTALFCLTSHPQGGEGEAGLSVEMMRHALWGLRRLRGRPCRPRIVAAVDPFALDAFSIPMEGLYAGFMAGYHVGFDRLANLRGAISRLLLGDASWESVSFRIASRLAAGGEVSLALAGGVPTTGRVYYAAREFLTRLHRHRPEGTRASELAARLSSDSGFEEFFKSDSVLGALRKSSRRLGESWVIGEMTSRSGSGHALDRVDQGDLPPEAKAALARCAGALGYGEAQASALIEDFSSEFSRQTPYRENLFRFIAARVVAKGIPIVLAPLRHDRPLPKPLRFGEPCALVGAHRARGGPLVRVLGADGAEKEMPVRDFAREFVRSRFP
jgi:hypothetical protein